MFLKLKYRTDLYNSIALSQTIKVPLGLVSSGKLLFPFILVCVVQRQLEIWRLWNDLRIFNGTYILLAFY